MKRYYKATKEQIAESKRNVKGMIASTKPCARCGAALSLESYGRLCNRCVKVRDRSQMETEG